MRAQGAERRHARPGWTRVRVWLWHGEGDGLNGQGPPGGEDERRERGRRVGPKEGKQAGCAGLRGENLGWAKTKREKGKGEEKEWDGGLQRRRRGREKREMFF